jgi:glyoxylase I family protein
MLARVDEGRTMNSIKCLDYTILFCRDLPRAVAFYQDVMRFQIEAERENWVNFRLGGSILALARRVRTDAEQSSEGSDGESVQLAFRVPPSRLDTCHRELIELGVTIVSPPRELPHWGHRMFLFRDPEGHLLEIYAEI